MCRIDQSLRVQSLEEKADPSERFIQALDEAGVAGEFRALLEKHFSNCWQRELRDIALVEKALRDAAPLHETWQQVSAFVAVIENNTSYFPVGIFDSLKYNLQACHAFAEEVATSVFRDAPLCLYSCFKGFGGVEYYLVEFAPRYYGKDFYLKPDFFEALPDLPLPGVSRKQILWGLFERLTWQGSPEQESFPDQLVAHLAAMEPEGSASKSANMGGILKAIAFLEAWMAADAKTRVPAESHSLREKMHNFFLDVDDRLDRNPDIPEHTKIHARAWTYKQRQNLFIIWLQHVAIDRMTEAEREDWGRDCHLQNVQLIGNLEPARVLAMARWHVSNLHKFVHSRSFFGICPVYGDAWYISPYRREWLDIINKEIPELHPHERLKILRPHFGYEVTISRSALPAGYLLPQGEWAEKENAVLSYFKCHVEQEHRDWWDGLLRQLPERGESFPEKLYPEWALAMCERFPGDEKLVPVADKCLGLLRRRMVDGESIHPNDFEKVWRFLERFVPEKALRQRLHYLRSATAPCSSESLEVDRNSVCPLSIQEMIVQQVSRLGVAGVDAISRNEQERGQLNQLRSWFADFCMSRLRLRKGEKVNGERYAQEQVVEQSAIWRQGYIKALSELGTDLQGKIHKTVYFTREHDPNDDVRIVAKECYKAVRRERIQSSTSTDIRRGLIAAYWWLLLAQRQAHGAKIDYDAAVLTRRRQLRHP